MTNQKDIWQTKSNFKVRYSQQFVKDEWINDLGHLLRHVPLSDFTIREEFEKQLAEYCRCKYAIAVNSGTTAIMIGMKVIGRSAKVVIGPNYGNIAWVNCAKFLGLYPHAIDIRTDNFCLDEDILEQRLSSAADRIYCVVYINQAGYTGDQLNDVARICNKHNIYLLEDSCNALGHWYNGVHAGLTGDMGFISFGVPKLISCGEGGAILLNSRTLYEQCKSLVYQGGWYDSNYTYLGTGANFVMPMHNAYFLSRQLKDIDELLQMREEVCNYYESQGVSFKKFPQAPSIYQYETPSSTKVLKAARQFSVEILKGYVTHSHFYMQHPERTPNAEYVQDNMVLLPNSLNLDEKSIQLVCGAIKMGETL